MSDTPKTDMFCRMVDHTAIVGGKIYQATIETVDASLARQLERELTEARAEIERRKADYAEMNEERLQWLGVIMKQEKLIEQMREALQYALAEARSTECERLIEAALSAAEGGEG